MYVWRNSDLPEDPIFPNDLGELGYMINEQDQIRQMANMEESWTFKINRNDRWNIKHREALNECIRTTVAKRLEMTGLEPLRLPLGRASDEPHVPILVSKNVQEATRIIVVFGEAVQDLGIWAYRAIHDGINHGSAVDFAHTVLTARADENIGLVIANTGQLIWHCGSERAVTQQTWQAIPRPYANWGQATMSWRNKIAHNGDWCDHVKYVFDKVLWLCVNQKQARFDVIGMSEGGLAAIRFLQRNWHIWQPYISAICLGDPQQTTYSDLNMGTLTDPKSFTSFVASRCRGYVLSDKPVGMPEFRYRDHGCNCFSSGEALNTECIMPAAWRDMLAWLDMLSANPEYSEHVMLRGQDMDEEMQLDLQEQAQAAEDEEEDTTGLKEMDLDTDTQAMNVKADGGNAKGKQPLKDLRSYLKGKGKGVGQENIKP